jgi:hypothetical protein
VTDREFPGRTVALTEERGTTPRRRAALAEPARLAAPTLLLVRLRPGFVGESRRVVHVVPVPTEGVPAALTAYCGAEIAAGTAEVLSGPSGMPCTLCLATAPVPEQVGR